MSTPGSLDFPEGFEAWPRSVQERWLSDYHALYFPKLRWWDKPESLAEDSGPRPSQLPPDHPRHAEADLQGNRCGCDGNPDWSTWLLLTGRGWGKTLCGANWVIEMALSKPGIYVGICAPTDKAVRSICIEGESGVEAVARVNGVSIVDYNKNRLELTFENGSKIRGFSAEKPDSIRGENLSYAWFDELAMIRYFQFYHEGLQPALRKGDNPRLLITTTPKRVRLLRDLLADGENEEETGVHVTRGRTAENPHYAARQRKALERKYAGTSMLRQELEGELLAEVDGCLFPLEKFNETRVFPGMDHLPQWRRVVVGYDPATTSSARSDESGIVVTAEGADGDYYCLEDCSGRFSPEQAMRVIAEAVYRNAADCVVAEVNVAGDFIRSLLNTVDPNIAIRPVQGMKGKIARAQGPSSLFMQGRVHMVGDTFAKLEEQLSAMTLEDDRSRMHDDRADACLAEGTLVLTSRGEVPIEQVVPGDLTWTRAGWKPVTAARCTQRNAEVITVILSDGRELTGTGDHRIWTQNDGWKRLDALVWGDILSGWKNHQFRSSSRAAPTIATRTVRAGATASTTSTTRPAESGICTVISGLPRIRARKSRKAGIFTTRTRIRSITTRLISSFCRQPSTVSSIPATSPGKKSTFLTTWTASGRWPRSGTAPKRALRGTLSTASAHGKAGSRTPPAPARSAAPSSSPCGPRRSGAQSPAATAPAPGTRSTSRLSRAPSAGTTSSVTSTTLTRSEPVPVSVVRSFASSERRDVYDLTVADVHEFTASGVIVHNCIWTLIHLAGGNQGDWGAVYGFQDCWACGSRVNFEKDEVCGHCGEKVHRPAPKHAGGRPVQVPWSVAYLKTCTNEKCGKTYPPREPTCPHCSMSPAQYMARALAMSTGQGGGWHSYTGRDWLAGRKF